MARVKFIETRLMRGRYYAIVQREDGSRYRLGPFEHRQDAYVLGRWEENHPTPLILARLLSSHFLNPSALRF